MQSECEQLISNLEQCSKNNENYKTLYLSYSQEKDNLLKYSFYGKTYRCNKNPSDINLKKYNKFEISHKYTSTTGINDTGGIIMYSKNDKNDVNYRDIPIL
jgi:hypothetical protein